MGYPTGLAPIGGLVLLAFPKDLGLWLCDATVVEQDRIRLHVANNGTRSTDVQELTIQFFPWVKRRPAIPGITFDLDEVEI